MNNIKLMSSLLNHFPEQKLYIGEFKIADADEMNSSLTAIDVESSTTGVVLEFRSTHIDKWNDNMRMQHHLKIRYEGKTDSGEVINLTITWIAEFC